MSWLPCSELGDLGDYTFEIHAGGHRTAILRGGDGERLGPLLRPTAHLQRAAAGVLRRHCAAASASTWMVLIIDGLVELLLDPRNRQRAREFLLDP
jgi:hypothetical protein